jgi:hypothetical protein
MNGMQSLVSFVLRTRASHKGLAWFGSRRRDHALEPSRPVSGRNSRRPYQGQARGGGRIRPLPTALPRLKSAAICASSGFWVFRQLSFCREMRPSYAGFFPIR